MKFFFILLLILFCKPDSFEDNIDNLNVGISSDPTTLDPIYSVDLTSQKINSLLFVKLFRFNKDGVLEGELAESFSMSINVLRLKIHRIETHNSETLNSDDVIYSLNRLKTEIGPRKSKYNFIKAFRKISEFELEIDLKSGNRKNLELLALAPASIYRKSAHQFDGLFLSSGIFYLEKWNKNQSLSLKLNMNARNYPNRMILQVLNQPSSAVYLFQKGNLDLMKIPYFLLSNSVVKENQKRIVKGKSVQYIAINANNPCFDLPFRKALNLSINRNEIIDKIFDSSASEINASVTNEYLINFTGETFHYPYNIELAKKYLAESKCFPEILERPLDLRMRADDENKAKGAVLAQSFKNLGLKILISPMEKTKLYKENGENKGDLTLLTWYIDFDSVNNFIDPLFASDSFGNAGNRAFYSHSKIDEFILEARLSPDTKSNPVEVVKLLVEEVPWVFLWSIHENYVLSRKATAYPELIELLVK